MIRVGYRVWGWAAVALGVIGLWWRDFDGVWQPVPATMPGRKVLLYVCALVLLLGGAAMQWRRTARVGAAGLMCVYSFFGFFWLLRVVGSPRIEGMWSGFGEQVALVMAGLVVLASSEWRDREGSSRAARIVCVAGRIVFGLCAVSWGLVHLFYVKETAALIPKWIPGQRVWAIVTGVFHLMGGVAIVSGVWARLAARLLTAMIFGFGIFVWVPMIVHAPGSHVAWGGTAVTAALMGAAWVIADSIAERVGVGEEVALTWRA